MLSLSLLSVFIKGQVVNCAIFLNFIVIKGLDTIFYLPFMDFSCCLVMLCGKNKN